jgi:transcriptional regulator with XRE-family HTH domain
MGTTERAVERATKVIAKNLRIARMEGGLSQKELAEKTNRSQPFVSDVENGKKPPNEGYITAVLKACNLPKDWNWETQKRGEKKKSNPLRDERDIYIKAIERDHCVKVASCGLEKLTANEAMILNRAIFDAKSLWLEKTEDLKLEAWKLKKANADLEKTVSALIAKIVELESVFLVFLAVKSVQRQMPPIREADAKQP